jgi:hypothetical protein
MALQFYNVEEKAASAVAELSTPKDRQRERKE